MLRASRVVACLFGLGILLLQRPTGAVPTYTPWSEPIWLGEVINSPWDDALASPSKDGLSLYFTSNRPVSAGGIGGYDIWVSRRPTKDAEWGSPVCLNLPVNTTVYEAGPWLSRDGHLLFFHRTSTRGDFDIVVASRRHIHDDFGWGEPVNLGSNINSEFNDAGATFFEGDATHPAELYFGSQRYGTFDIFRSVLDPDGNFGPAEYVAELSGPSADQRPTISFNGKEMYLTSPRAGGLGEGDIWVSTRSSLDAPWSEPVNVAELNTNVTDAQAVLSAKGDLIFFNSTRSPNIGATDLWVATRTKVGR